MKQNKPIQVRTAHEDSKSLRLVEFLDIRHKKVTSLPALSSGPLYLPRFTADHLLLEADSKQRFWNSNKKLINVKSHDSIGNRTRDFPVCLMIILN
jgi:hypothetical protein